MEKETKTDSIEIPNELDFVDEDIKEAFKGKSYFVGTPSNLQLARNVKILSDVMQEFLNKIK